MKNVETSINIDVVKKCIKSTLTNDNIKKAIICLKKLKRKKEKLLYPYFNAALLKHLDIKKVKGIGSGILNYQSTEEIDCLVYFDNYKIAIELKWPQTTNDLLYSAGENNKKKLIGKKAKFTDYHEEFGNCLKNVDERDVYYGDSKTGDIVKLLNLINEKAIHEGYCIGLLQSGCKEGAKYKTLLDKMIKCVNCYANPKKMNVSVEYSYVEDMDILISISPVKSTE